ncbi:F-box protein At3g07870-like [Salvia hispanica]|uniref:F-box protein At3g07870-like n=1 Tax=Salvia hispanica TaxID=49212 RepID=UPI00200966BB|nr:F-box protein At3g07870-like [Salvia hispanica]
MGDFLTNLPEQVTREIIERVPVNSLIRCKCVRKSWRSLINEPEFKTSYSPKPCLAFSYENKYMVYDDEARKPLFRFSMNPPRTIFANSVPYSVVIDSTDGLLLTRGGYTDTLYVCNPLTREYVELPPLNKNDHNYVFGFGVSKISGQYKVLCCEVSSESCKCYVYTLGEGGSWRTISAATPGSPILRCTNALFCNGNLHWLASYSDFEGKHLVCCFDLKTELFTSFFLPPHVGKHGNCQLCILEGRLCLCVYLDGHRVVIWKMNKYGDGNSWVKEYTLCLPPDTGGLICPLKVLDNGDLLLALIFGFRLFIYSKNTKDVKTHALLHQSGSVEYNIAAYTPSFVSLKAMGIHNVQSLNLYS